jgi:predicted thioesterase
MAQIPVGTRREQNLLVTSDVAVDFLGLEEARVLGTPYLIAHLEMTSRNAIRPLLETGYDTVGTHVDVRHLAATPLGMQVRLYAEVTQVDDRRVTFRVEAWDEKEKVAEGTHERFIVNVARFATRLQAKAAGNDPRTS